MRSQKRMIFAHRRQRHTKAWWTVIMLVAIFAGSVAINRTPEPAKAHPVFGGTGIAEPLRTADVM